MNDNKSPQTQWLKKHYLVAKQGLAAHCIQKPIWHWLLRKEKVLFWSHQQGDREQGSNLLTQVSFKRLGEKRLVYKSTGRASFDWRALDLGHLWKDMVRGFSTRSSWDKRPFASERVPVFKFWSCPSRVVLEGGGKGGFGSGCNWRSNCLLWTCFSCMTCGFGLCLWKATQYLVRNRTERVWTDSAVTITLFMGQEFGSNTAKWFWLRVSQDFAVISSFDWGRIHFQAHSCGCWQIAWVAIRHGSCFHSEQVIWRKERVGEGGKKNTQGRNYSLYNLISEVTSCNFCYILFDRNKSLSPAHTQHQRICEHDIF